MATTVDTVILEQRAAALAQRTIKGAAKADALRLALSMLDLTTLEGKDSPEKVRALCAKAVRPDIDDPSLPTVAAVCVYPSLVRTAAEALASYRDERAQRIKIAAVATGFPSGQYPLAVRLDDTRRALDDGASEIDMVISRGLFLAGELGAVHDEIAQVKALCAGRAALKVILETGELGTYDAVRRASDLALRAGLGDGDFIKTSTGKVQPAATAAVTLVMLEAVRAHYRETGMRIGVKPAGGIRTSKQAMHFLVMVHETLGEAWLTADRFRFGASTLMSDIVLQLRRSRLGLYPSAASLGEG